MSDMPFSRGGLIPPSGPGSDLVLALIRPGEPVMPLWAAREWLASGLSLEDWLEQHRNRQEGSDGDAG